ncbi:hypothetical protein AB0J52_24235, partial [Spirillospora sp. NPDC049652]
MEQAFQVDLRGVVDLLSRHLYSSPRVYLRELLQNAVDASTARAALDAAVATGAADPGAPGTEGLGTDGLGTGAPAAEALGTGSIGTGPIGTGPSASGPVGSARGARVRIETGGGALRV